MKLKNILALSLFAMAFSACETVDEDERFIGPVDFEPKKNVLIEDFTGQRCINCPKASESISQLQKTYGKEHVIAVAIHGGPMSLPAPHGLATQEGQTYNNHWNVESWPNGLVNRTNGLAEHTSWTAKTVEEFMKEAGADIRVNNSYDAANRTLTVTTEVEGKLDTQGKLQLWLVENDIETYQVMPDGSHNRSYNHNHVFRTSINGTWGKEITLKKDNTQKFQDEYKIENTQWKPENMAVVAFVTDAAGQVLQVVESKVIQ